MNKLTRNTIAATAFALTLPVAAFAQAGESTSGYSTGAGNPTSTSQRDNPAAVTSGTTGASASSTDHTGNQDPSGHTGTARNGVVETSSTNSSTSTAVKPDSSH